MYSVYEHASVTFIWSNDLLIRPNESFIRPNESFIRPNESFNICSNESFICMNDLLIRLNEEIFFFIWPLYAAVYFQMFSTFSIFVFSLLFPKGVIIWISLYQSMLFAKFGWHWPSCFREEDKNVKSLLTDRRWTIDDQICRRPWLKLDFNFWDVPYTYYLFFLVI